MLKKRYIWLCLMLLGVGLLLVSCGDDDDNDLAPDSIQGKTYQMIVTSGTFPLASSGTAAIVFAADGTYTVTDASAKIGYDEGTYTYQKLTDDSGELTITSTLNEWLQLKYTFTFTQEKAGNFSGALVSDPTITQQGTFTEL